MINGTNMLGKGNPSWPISNAAETKTVPDALRAGGGVVIAWLIGLPRRAGRRLFTMNDEEARWHRWQVTETHRGLGRRYRNPGFTPLMADDSLRRDKITGNDTRPEPDGCPLSGREGLRRPTARRRE